MVISVLEMKLKCLLLTVISADTCHFFVTGIIMNQLAPHIKYFKVYRYISFPPCYKMGHFSIVKGCNKCQTCPDNISRSFDTISSSFSGGEVGWCDGPG